jgi:RHS repeat-associated protein
VTKTGNIWICSVGFNLFQPATLVYTDPYGRVYTMGGDGSLRSVKDLANNTLTVTATGITSSNGLSVAFVRDGQGRITKITDPLLKEYSYTYNPAGELETVKYPEVARAAQYTYDATHLYKGGTDSRNNPLPVTAYYPDGRLKSVTVHPDPATSYTTSYVYDTTTPVTVTYPGNTTATGFRTTITNPDSTTTSMVYDAYGKLLSSTDGLNHTTLNQYDANHNLIAVSDPLGHTTKYAYDGNGNRTSVTYPPTGDGKNTTSYTEYNAASEPTQTKDEKGNIRTFAYDENYWPQLAGDVLGPVVSFSFNANGTMASKAVGYNLAIPADSGKATTYSYDGYGNLTGEIDGLGRQTTYEYDTLGRKKSVTPPDAPATAYAYDALGHLLTVTAPQGRITKYEYDENGNKLSETTAFGTASAAKTAYEYDALNRLIKVTYPDTKTTTYTYDFRNNVIDTVDQANRTTHNVYDAAGRLTSVTQAFNTADAITTSYTYYDDGRKATETTAAGTAKASTMTYHYDAAGRLTSVVDAQSHTTEYEYDEVGNQVRVTDANNHVTKQEYDERKRLKKTTYDDLTTPQYSYDGPGNLTSVIDQGGKEVRYTYDAANQLKKVIQVQHPDASHNTTQYDYDGRGNLKTATDANAHTTTSGFDELNQLKTEKLPSGNLTQTREYDAAGNLKSLTDYNGHTTTYTYDGMNRLLSKVPDPVLNETTESFTYTATGKRWTMMDASGTTTYGYDNLDRLVTKATPQGTLTYTYDQAGNVASMKSSNVHGVWVTYTWDNLNRLATVVDNNLPVGQNTTTYGYDAASNLGTVTYPNGLVSNFTYDTLNRVKAVNGYQYQLDPDTGMRKGVTEPNGRTVVWNYDGIYRLTNETISLDPHPTPKNGSLDYGLDPVGNRLSQTSTLPGISTGSATFDLNDRLSTETYDPNGNTTITGSRSFTYDFENRLKTMAVNSGPVTVTLLYDGDGNRVAKTVSGVTARYLVDDLNPTGYAQVVEEIVASTVQRTYTYGSQRINQNQLINSTWTPTFYGYDGFGSVRTLTNAASTVTDTFDYDAWGNAVNTTGSTPNVYLYRGEQYDSDLNLHYLRARYFNPLTGRFLTRDTYRGEMANPVTQHPYLYTGSNPVNITDPSGHGWGATFISSAENTGWVTAAFVATASILCIWQEGVSQLNAGHTVDLLPAHINPTAEVQVSICGVAVLTKSRGRSDDISRPLPIPITKTKDEPRNSCEAYEGAIQRALDDVKGRYYEMLADVHGLYGCSTRTPWGS